MNHQANTKEPASSSSVLQEISEVLARWREEASRWRADDETPFACEWADTQDECAADLERLLRHAHAEIEGLRRAVKAMTEGDEAEVSAIIAMTAELVDNPNAKVLLRHCAAQGKRIQAAEARAEAAEGRWQAHAIHCPQCQTAKLRATEGATE